MSKLIKDFMEKWSTRGSEKSESQSYWIELLQALGVQKPTDFIQFEKTVKDGRNTIYIDGYIPKTKVLIEMKSSTINLDDKLVQSNGDKLTPFEQAQKYIVHLPRSEHPRYVVTCNFKEIRVYDMENPNNAPASIFINELNTQSYRLSFLVKEDNVHLERQVKVSKEAVQLISKLYDAFSKQYKTINEETSRNLNILCVRIVFCLFADDSGLFEKNQFINFIQNSNVGFARQNLINLFKVLDTDEKDRDPYDTSGINSFPYVNGGLFKEVITIPTITEDMLETLVTVAEFDWSQISPTIFGSIFESTLSAKRRHENGMHYTSVVNIHKVIDNLFLDEFYAEFDQIRGIERKTLRSLELRKFQMKLATYKFLDPACGSGNFLTETYTCIRRLENEIIREIRKCDTSLFPSTESPIKVNIHQFYGIEIDDFAVSVARTALWIAEAQMFEETKDIGFDIDFFPLKSNNNIVEGNALRIDWAEVVGGVDTLNYIIGNPPFLGARRKGDAQWDDIQNTFPKSEWRNVGNFDYVLCWFKKSADMMLKNNKIKAALVATNSICQGEPVGTFWKRMLELGVHINFAYKSFIWNNGADDEAKVFVVILGFSLDNRGNKYIIDTNGFSTEVSNINPYLIEADDIVVEPVNKPICNVPEIHIGSMPQDGGYLSKISTQEKDAIIAKYPQSKEWFKQLVGGDEFLKGKERWCLWLVGIDIEEIKKVPPVYKRVEDCRKYRENQTTLEAQKTVNTPHLFARNKQPISDYLVIPILSTINRDYIPIGYMDKNYIVNNRVQIINNVNKYLFSIFCSDVHNMWFKLVSGYMGDTGANYSSQITYNNFLFITPTTEEEQKLTDLANNILKALANHPNKSLADLYDPENMPDDLRKAHKENDIYVRSLYGFKPDDTKEHILAGLLTCYKALSTGQIPEGWINVKKTNFVNKELEKPVTRAISIISKAKSIVDHRISEMKPTDNTYGMLSFISNKLKNFYGILITVDFTPKNMKKIVTGVEKIVSLAVPSNSKSLQDTAKSFENILNNYEADIDYDYSIRLLKLAVMLDSLVQIDTPVSMSDLRSILGIESEDGIINKYFLSDGVSGLLLEDIQTDLNTITLTVSDGNPVHDYLSQLIQGKALDMSTSTTLYVAQDTGSPDCIASKYGVTIVIYEEKGNKIKATIVINGKLGDVLYDLNINKEL